MANVLFRYTPDYVSTLAKWAVNRPGLASKVTEFKRIKAENPVQPFGKKDIRMISDGPFGRTIAGIRHVHLTKDLSLFYTLSGADPHVFTLYGIYSHSESGTGDSPNVNVQKSLAQRMSSMQSDTNEPDISSGTDKEKSSGKFKAGTGGKVDYTSKQKQEPTPSEQTKSKINDPLPEFVRMIDSKWPKQNFANRINDAKSIHDKLEVINKEAHYLGRIKQQINRLHPNQEEYARGLQILSNYLADLQRQKK